MTNTGHLLTAKQDHLTAYQAVETLLESGSDQFTVIVCCTRSEFLKQILQVTEQHDASNTDKDNEMLLGPDNDLDQQTDTTVPTLLVPTLQLLANSERIRLVFCPSVPIFRAYLATFPYAATRVAGSKLLIFNMLSLHHGTSEFTLQGLSRSFALLASIVNHIQCHTRLAEFTDIKDIDSPYTGSRLWNVEVPLLNESIKIGDAGQGWAARTVSIKKVASTWLLFA